MLARIVLTVQTSFRSWLPSTFTLVATITRLVVLVPSVAEADHDLILGTLNDRICDH